MHIWKVLLLLLTVLSIACSAQLNNPYGEDEGGRSVLYRSFDERPKHLDPAVSYSTNEYVFISQIYEPPFQYHYLKRPYQLVPLTASKMPEIRYFNQQGERLSGTVNDSDIAFTDYLIDIQPGVRYQPHPALAKDSNGHYLYHALSADQIANVNTLNDFSNTGSRELMAEDYVYQIKRLAHPKVQSPIAEIMKNYIVGFDEFSKQVANQSKNAIKDYSITGVEALGPTQYRVRIKGKYPQFLFWLAMPFFAPMPWEADAFYNQPGLFEKNISLDWYPIGTGAYYLAENNPNRRMILLKNPFVHAEAYPSEGEAQDKSLGLLDDAGKPLPLIDKVVFMLEKETIPRWTKFLQGYFDASAISSDNFGQAIQFSGGSEGLTPAMEEKGISLQTTVETSISYMGFNMLDATIGGNSDQARKLRQAITIAVDYDEYISIFLNGRGLPAQGFIPPGIFGYDDNPQSHNPYLYDWKEGRLRHKSIDVAKQLLSEAGYANGIDPKTKAPLILYFDTGLASIDDRPRANWFRKQLEKLGIQLVVRATDYNRFQEKIRMGNAQLFTWGWNADYPDPENFFSLLYGGNGKVKHGGENAVNYDNAEFNTLFEKMRNMDNTPQRYQIIQQMQDIIRRDAPMAFGYYPKQFVLLHSWYKNLKANAMANNEQKYLRIDSATRNQKRQLWNQPIIWPLLVVAALFILLLIPAIYAYRRYTQEPLQ